MHKKLEGDAAGTADPHWPKWYSIPYDDMLRNGEKSRKRGVFGAMVFVFPSNHYTWWSPACYVVVGSFNIKLKLQPKGRKRRKKSGDPHAGSSHFPQEPAKTSNIWTCVYKAMRKAA